MSKDTDEYTTIRVRRSTLAAIRAELARMEARLAKCYQGDRQLRRAARYETNVNRGEERISLDCWLVWILDQLEQKRRRSREASYRRRDRRRASRRPASAPLPD